MTIIHQVIRLNYTRIAQNIDANIIFLSELLERTEDEQFKQSLIEVIYSLNNLSDTVNLQRRYLTSRSKTE